MKLVAVAMALLSIVCLIGFATSQNTTATTTPSNQQLYYLSNYPQFLFDSNNNLKAFVVVGQRASTEDIVGAIDVMIRLAGDNTEKVTIPISGQISGAQTEDIPLGSPITGVGLIDRTLTNNEIKGLQDASIDFQGDSYDVHEEIRLGNNTPVMQTSLTGNKDDYKENVYMEINRGDIAYYHVFDDDINITTASQDEPLEVFILGNKLTITKVNSQTSFTAQLGQEIVLSTGETKTVEGKILKLVAVSNNDRAIVSVDGEQVIVGTTAKTVNGLKIKILVSFAEENGSGSAQLLVGSDIEKTYKDGDAFIGESKTDPDWIWEIDDLNTLIPVIGVKNDMVKNSIDDNPVTDGDCYSVPKGEKYISVCFDKLTVDDADYASYELSLRNSVDLSRANEQSFSWGTSESVFQFLAPADDGILLWHDSPAWSLKGNNFTDDMKTRKIYLFSQNATQGNVSVFYYNKDGAWKFAGTIINNDPSDNNVFGYVNYKSTKGNKVPLSLTGNFSNNTLYLEVQDGVISNDNTSAWIHQSGNEFDSLGALDGQSEANELLWNNKTIGTKDNDLRTAFGVIISNPDNEGSSDKVQLKIPADQVKAKVIVEGTGTIIIGNETQYYYKTKPITTSVSKLDTEVNQDTDTTLILIGGSCANSMVQKLVDNGKLGQEYTCAGGTGSGWKENEAYIFVIPNAFVAGRTVVVVAGYSATDTRYACLTLNNYVQALSGINSLSAKVVGGSVTAK